MTSAEKAPCQYSDIAYLAVHQLKIQSNNLSVRIAQKLDEARDLYGDGCRILPKSTGREMSIQGPCPSQCDSKQTGGARGHSGRIRFGLLLKIQQSFELYDDRSDGEACALRLIRQRGILLNRDI